MSTEGERLAKYVLDRRAELDLSQLDVWQAGGPSNTTLTKIESGSLGSLSRTTAKKLDHGLQWVPGSARAVWAGGVPTALLEGVAPERTARLRRIIEQSDMDQRTRGDLLAALDDLDDATG